jgi:hypothetical protein
VKEAIHIWTSKPPLNREATASSNLGQIFQTCTAHVRPRWCHSTWQRLERVESLGKPRVLMQYKFDNITSLPVHRATCAQGATPQRPPKQPYSSVNIWTLDMIHLFPNPQHLVAYLMRTICDWFPLYKNTVSITSESTEGFVMPENTTE